MTRASTGVLDLAVADHVATITLNRPDRHNAFDPETVVRLADAWTAVEHDDEVRAVVLASAGDGTFCAGGDLKRLVPLLTRARPAEDEWDERLLADQKTIMNQALLRRSAFGKPIIAAVQGRCLAGGTELVLATDLRVASRSATFALTEVQRGLIPGGGSVARLPRQVPRAVAMEMLLVGEPITAQRAYDLGLVNELVDPGRALERATEIARRIAANAPLAVREAKRVAAASPDLPLEDALALEDGATRTIMRSDDAREGARAFGERRPPRFTGR